MSHALARSLRRNGGEWRAKNSVPRKDLGHAIFVEQQNVAILELDLGVEFKSDVRCCFRNPEFACPFRKFHPA
jgi:hypothetical protein